MLRRRCLLPTLLCLTATANVYNTNNWRMKPVTVIQARIQGTDTVYHPDVNLWLSKYGDTVEAAYMNSLDTCNTASVEGALMYVQAEGINVNEQSVKCERKNNMQSVVFYEITIVQPARSLEHYQNYRPTEYGEFVAMDGAKCTDAGTDLPLSCKAFSGLDGTPNLGYNVGCSQRETDPRAPYPLNYWCSFPGACAQKYRKEKTPECRARYPGGLCPMGVQPDGEKCTFSYKILGFLKLDDLVGITKMGFADYKQFCESGNVEFKARNTGQGFEVEQSIDFWKDPGNRIVNRGRSAHMVAMYNYLASSGISPNMIPLPDIAALTAKNPKCYENSALCRHAKHGCRRLGYSQICTECSAGESGCDIAPA